jgi:outer membrane protein OmpA-like peptidoglycan-associated protein
MMRRIVYVLVFWVTICLPFTGFAQFKPVDLNPQIKSGQLVQKTDNVVVLFDKSSSMGEMEGKPVVNESTRLIHAKNATKNMITAMPEIQLNAGLRTLWYEETKLIYGMKPLSKVEYIQAVNSIENVNHRTPLGKAITAAGNDLKSAQGNSAIIIVSDFSDLPGIVDIKQAVVMDAITQVNADYGNRLCVYAIQVGSAAGGKDLSEEIVQNVIGGYAVNANRLETPAAMASFVEKVLTGDCSRYQQRFAKSQEPAVPAVIVTAQPVAEERVVAVVQETKPETVVAVVMETKPEEKVIILAFEDIHFDFDKSTLKPEAQAILTRSIQMLKDNPNSKVRVAGYASASGTGEYNQKLSERRATAVQEYLVNEGVIGRDRLSTIGYGETNPAMYEASPKDIYSVAAKANMRVLFEITAR